MRFHRFDNKLPDNVTIMEACEDYEVIEKSSHIELRI